MSGARDACGVVGLYSRNAQAAKQIYFGLFALQHRGQESSGITVSDGKILRSHKAMGLVPQVFNEKILTKLKGPIGIGHNRYSTTGSSNDANAQPFTVSTKIGKIAVAHNGNLVNYHALKSQLLRWQMPLHQSSKSDSALIAQLIAYFIKVTGNLPQATERAFEYLQGSFSLMIMSRDTLIGLRDRNGLRPLCLGSLPNQASVLASESCALDVIGASLEREITPGEMLVINCAGQTSRQLAKPDPKLCVFEFVYTARPDSMLLGQSVYQVRKRFGMELAKEYRPRADVVIPVPASAVPAAIGYAQATKLPFEEGLIKNRYIHRTFIEPDPAARRSKVSMKLSPLESAIAGKRVVLIDDSTVRGTTSKQIVQLIKQAGAKEVHFLVSSPPIKYPDFYGIDIPDASQLIAAQKSLAEIRGYIGATSLHYLSMAGMLKLTGVSPHWLCTSCFSGEYPVYPQQLKQTRRRQPALVNVLEKVRLL